MSGKKKINTGIQGSKLSLEMLLPSGTASGTVLDNRAAILSKEEVCEVDQDLKSTCYLKFKLGHSDYYGIPYADINDVKLADRVTKVPNTPGFVIGVHYWHGKIIPVVDLNKYFKINTASQSGDGVYIATISDDKSFIAFSFNDIVGVDSYTNSQLQTDFNGIGSIDNKYVEGIHSGNICILNVKEILAEVADNIVTARGEKS